LTPSKFLLDINVLIALADPHHIHHQLVMRWFGTGGFDWGVCAFTEAGFLRVTTNPKLRMHSVEEASGVLAGLTSYPGYRFWTITSGWTTIVAPFAERVLGHQQITDAYLLGLAIKDNGVLVTLDKAIRYMAGPKYSTHLLVLE
jgi:toxin-antitoxin system PIN domain toxin